jgi:hypothetical protein
MGLSPFGTSATIWRIVPALDDDDDGGGGDGGDDDDDDDGDCEAVGGMRIGRGN